MQCFTEYTRQVVTFTCHPNHKNEGPWYDYGMFAWEQESTTKSGKPKHKGTHDWNKEVFEVPVTTEEFNRTNNVTLIPGKIMSFVSDHKGDMFAIVHLCLENSVKISVLTYRWQLEYAGDKPVPASYKPYNCAVNAQNLTPIYCAVSVDTLQKHCLMLPYQEMGKSRFLMQVVD